MAGDVGDSQLTVMANVMSLAAGGGVRVSLKDNIRYDRQKAQIETNTELVKRTVNIAEAEGRKPYTCREARGILGL